MIDLRLAITTASFLPWTALSVRAVRRVFAFAQTNGFDGVEVLITRAVCRGYRGGAFSDLAQRTVSTHEVWNPRDTMLREILRILRRKPQSRGMVPYPMDGIFFNNRDASEGVLFDLAADANGIAVVSQLTSPVTGRRYESDRAAVQVHSDLGPGGAHMPLRNVREAVIRENYPVVLDTNHVRRRVRMCVDGFTEIAPPVAGPDDLSLGGIARVWHAFSDRVALAHFQPNNAAELRELLGRGTLPPSLDEFRAILPALAERRVPVVIEISPPMAADVAGGKALARQGATTGAAEDVLRRVKDVLARDAAMAQR
ncbi:MAG: hypothetical protein V1929_02310 [bacterium]